MSTQLAGRHTGSSFSNQKAKDFKACFLGQCRQGASCVFCFHVSNIIEILDMRQVLSTVDGCISCARSIKTDTTRFLLVVDNFVLRTFRVIFAYLMGLDKGMKNLLSLFISLATVGSFAAKPVTAQAIQASAPASVSRSGDDVGSTTTSSSSSSTVRRRPRIGLALGGGGSRGAAHVGVLKVLKENNIPIDMIAGTSIGSVVGGFYAAGVPLDQIGEVFEKGKFTKEFVPMPILRLALEPTALTLRMFGYRPYDGLYYGWKFRKYANEVAGSKKIEQLSIPYAAVVTNVVTGESCRLTDGDLGLAMQASTAVPELKKPVQIGQKLYCDGGVINNVPVNHVREMGADFVIAVDIDEPLKDVPLKNFRALGSMGRQALRIQLATFDMPNRKKADLYIHPDTSGINLVSFNKGDGKRGIEAGEVAARAAMPEIKRKLAALGVVTGTVVNADIVH